MIVILDALEAVFAATSDYHRAARALRNRLIVMTLIALVTAAVLVLLQWSIPTATMTPRPKDLQGVVNWQLLIMVMAFGAIGALLTTIRPISTMGPARSPFNFPLQQAFLKIAVGALTSVVGVIAVSAAMSEKGFDNAFAVFGAAAAFGAAQQAVTRMLDDRASALIKTNPSSPSSD